MMKIKKVGLGLIGIGSLMLIGIWLVLKAEPKNGAWANQQTVVAVTHDNIRNSGNSVAECVTSN
ncbi:hypothetical protein [Lactiplantibacillus plantarum]|uniref:hypothetical protein n=2 Tax=Lactiplantibacillus plantarum TaxID=1590 RepID=UPI000FECA2A0|nr:hypothetical protein [Lactiplantibacillus plantarum]MBS0956728.1 hypothetical protein [Lactiplantibacillus plantarum]QAR38585.1 hypothetical protein EQJ27_11915 [Lactiplantibacillus plantarum]RWZ08759.1 hypothetical protein EQG51_11910 [Lactiplantibacillus plantarum]RWZ36600.1 hypothetical protein EQG59_11910 [Lactiplantibacillus plantarum]